MDPNANKYLLFNKLSAEDAKKKLEGETFKRTTFSFYKYAKLKDISYYRDYLRDKKTYIFAMMKELDWEVIESRVQKADKVSKIMHG